MFKSILLHLDNDDSHVARVDAAIALAERFEAHIIALHVVKPADLPPPDMPIDMVASGGPALGTPVVGDGIKALGEEFAARCARANLSCDWIVEEGDLMEVLAEHSHFADLAVVGSSHLSKLEDSLFFTVPEHLPLSAGCPVLVVPGVPHQAEPGRRILVAWKPTRECARAVRDALPLLQAASRVTVLSVCAPVPEHLVDERIGHFLAAHGVRYQILNHMAPLEEAPEIIRRSAEEFSCDMVVMGCYGHSRLREVLRGGVTRHLLNNSTLPLFMSH